MTLTLIADRMEEGNLTGEEIARFRNYCATWLYRLNTEYGELSSLAALWITANRETYKSHAECERAWEAGEKGQRQTQLKYQIRGIEHISDALLTNYSLLRQEMKSLSS